MISIRHPTDDAAAVYRLARLDAQPTGALVAGPRPGFRHERFTRHIGVGVEDFERARLGLQQWAAHRGSEVEVGPVGVEVEVGETVAIVTRQVGLWVLAACRVTSLVDEPTAFGFTYSTLPDHPECGDESFVVRLVSDDVIFEIEATSRPGIPLVRLAGPAARQLQKRAANGYLDALARWTAGTV